MVDESKTRPMRPLKMFSPTELWSCPTPRLKITSMEHERTETLKPNLVFEVSILIVALSELRGGS